MKIGWVLNVRHFGDLSRRPGAGRDPVLNCGRSPARRRKGLCGRAAALHCGGLRCATAALRCSVLRPRRITHYAPWGRFVQTDATSQTTIRAAREAASPALLGATEARRDPPAQAFAARDRRQRAAFSRHVMTVHACGTTTATLAASGLAAKWQSSVRATSAMLGRHGRVSSY